jgi:hypothetical protein
MCLNEASRSRDQIIRRLQKTADVDPPWAGIDFVYPILSDELADALRQAYPEGKNLRERKHLAVIDFLKSELEEMRSSETTIGSLRPVGVNSDVEQARLNSHKPNDGQLVVNRQQGAPSQTPPSVLSPLDSPRVIERAQRGIEGRPTPDVFKHSSIGAEGKTPSDKEATVPAMPVVTTQTFVFSAMDGKPVQPRIKKTMSAQEKQEYRKTRQRGACVKCRRTKAKVLAASQLSVSISRN